MTQPTYSGPYRPLPPDHPQATTVLLLGILGLVVCGVLAPFAWIMGNRVQAEIATAQGQLGGQGSVQAGRIMGMIGTGLLALGALVLIGLLLIFVVVGVGASTSG